MRVASVTSRAVTSRASPPSRASSRAQSSPPSTTTPGGGSRRFVTARAKKSSRASAGDAKYAVKTTDDALKYDPTKSLADVLASKDAADEANGNSSNDWASSLAAFREEKATKDRTRAEMGAEMADIERKSNESDDLMDTTWVTEAGTIARREFRGLDAGEEEATFGEDEAEFVAFGMNEDAGEEVWGPGDEGFEVYMYDDDDDEGEGEVTQERGRGIPREMRCFDTAKIYVKAGDGGDGAGCVQARKVRAARWTIGG